jgi:hypothetical protein
MSLGGASFVVTITATCATEAYLSEVLAHLTEKKCIAPEEREKVRRQDGLWSKYNALAQAYGGRLDEQPIYRSYQALVHLRNCLVHRSAEYLEAGEWPPKLAPFKRDIPHVSGDGLDWTSQVLDVITAEWSETTATTFLKLLDEYIPDPSRHPFIDPGAGA